MQEVSASEAQTQTELLKEIMGHIYGPKVWQFFSGQKLGLLQYRKEIQ